MKAITKQADGHAKSTSSNADDSRPEAAHAGHPRHRPFRFREIQPEAARAGHPPPKLAAVPGSGTASNSAKTAPGRHAPAGARNTAPANPEDAVLADMLGFVGYITAPMMVHYIDWVLARAKHPVRIALRDGEVISHVAARLASSDIRKGGYNTLGGWRDVYLTRDLTARLDLSEDALTPFGRECDDKLVFEYMEQTGTDRPFTMLDTGYVGSIHDRFHRRGIGCQSLFICSNRGDIPAFLDKAEVRRILVRANVVIKELDKKIKSFCFSFFEELPKLHKSPEEFMLGRDGSVAPKLVSAPAAELELHRMFYAGLDLYMDELANGKTKLMPMDKCIEFAFRSAYEMQNIVAGFTSSDARFNRKHAARKALEFQNIQNVYRGIGY